MAADSLGRTTVRLSLSRKRKRQENTESKLSRTKTSKAITYSPKIEKEEDKMAAKVGVVDSVVVGGVDCSVIPLKHPSPSSNGRDETPQDQYIQPQQELEQCLLSSNGVMVGRSIASHQQNRTKVVSLRSKQGSKLCKNGVKKAKDSKKQLTLDSFLQGCSTKTVPANTSLIQSSYPSRDSLCSSGSSSTSDSNQSSNWRGGRCCPSYKWIPGTSFTVDAFCYGAIPNCTGYFLSHFHSDHYMGLNRRFKGQIYCSKVTGNLVCSQLKVPASAVHCLPVREAVAINGVMTTLIEANHCPGSVMFLFELSNGKRILHTGDFRAIPSIYHSPPLAESFIDTLFLDTTYTFPSQESIIQFVVDCAVKFVSTHPDTLVVCGTYTIGKEKIFQSICKALDCKVFVSQNKKRIIDCLESRDLSDMCVTDTASITRVHVVPLNNTKPQDLLGYLTSFQNRFGRVLAFKPTGWAYHSNYTKPQVLHKGLVTIYSVPYSEHSSFTELKEFVQFLKPKTIVSTVGGFKARSNTEAICKQWLRKEHLQLTLEDTMGIKQ